MKGGICPIFFANFFISVFLAKGVYFLQNANTLNFELLFRLYHDPQSKYSAFI